MNRIIIGTLAMAIFAFANPAVAEDSYPNRAVKIIVPFTAGGITDNVARKVAAELSTALAQPVIIDNKPGAGGALGTDLAARAESDGYTLFLGSQGTQAINPAINKTMTSDPIEALSALQAFIGLPVVITVNAEGPYETLDDLISYATAHPNVVNYATTGIGTTSHLSAELLQSKAGAQMTHIPYKGSAPAITDLIGGQVDVAFDYFPTVIPHIKSGRLRALAVTGAKRLPGLPEVKTIAEAGYPGAESAAWIGIFAPSETPYQSETK